MKHLGFKFTLLLSSVLVVAIALSTMGFFAKNLVLEQTTQKVQQKLQSALIHESQKIEHTFSQTIRTVTELSQLYKNGEVSMPSERLMAQTVQLTGVYKILVGFDDGSSYVSRPSESFPNGVGLKEKYNPTARPWYQSAKQHSGLSLSDVFFTKSTQTPMVGVMHTIPDGVILADIRLDQLQVQLQEVTEHHGASAIIADGSGVVLASTLENIEIQTNLSETELSSLPLAKNAQSQANYFERQIGSMDKAIIVDSLELADGHTWYFIFMHDKDTAFADVQAATYKLLGIVLFVVALSSIIMLLVLNWVYSPINSLKALVTELSDGSGDLTRRLKVSSKDDLGQIATGVNRFIENLQGMLTDIRKETEKLTGEVDDMQAIEKQTSKIISQHADETTTIVTAVEELSVSASVVAESAQEAANYTEEAETSSDQSHVVAQQAHEQILSLASDVETTVERVTKMNEQTKNIQSIVEVIHGIAEQTNLLALNASIEAARAGEQGRGFAVVADEVRALANRTQNSTQQIADALNALEGDSSALVEAIGTTQSNCLQTVDHVESISANLTQLTGYARQINQVSQHISSSSGEQKTIIGEISGNIHQLHDMVKLLEEEKDKQSGSTKNVSSISLELKRRVNSFQI